MKQILLIFLLGINLIYAQESNLKTEEFVVKGNCGMCKTRIENVVSSQPSAKGEWNQGTKILTITYDESKTNSDKILKLVADAGNDNEKYESDDDTYESLPGCCLYERDLSYSDYKEKYKSGNLDSHHILIHNDHSNHSEQMDHSDHQNHSEHNESGANHSSMNHNADSVELESANIEGRKAATALDTESADLTYNIDEKELLKAACCNISESFETNAAVDVSYSDAVTGSRQILMLGLNQNYTHISSELLPNARGLSKSYGLDFLPGKWISGIQC